MPFRTPHACANGTCPNSAPAGQSYCDTCAAQRKDQPPAPKDPVIARLYQSRRWKDKDHGIAALVRSKNPLCQYLDDSGHQCTHAATIVHHLIDPKDDPSRFFDWLNLVAVCSEHHQGGQRGETQGYRYCHTIGPCDAVYAHGFLFPTWHPKYVAQDSEFMVSLTTSAVGSAAILKALQEPI